MCVASLALPGHYRSFTPPTTYHLPPTTLPSRPPLRTTSPDHLSGPPLQTTSPDHPSRTTSPEPPLSDYLRKTTSCAHLGIFSRAADGAVYVLFQIKTCFNARTIHYFSLFFTIFHRFFEEIIDFLYFFINSSKKSSIFIDFSKKSLIFHRFFTEGVRGGALR